MRENLVLGANVTLGEDVEIGANVVIHDDTVIGDGCVIQDNVVLGKAPRLSARSTARRDPLPGGPRGGGRGLFRRDRVRGVPYR